MKHLLSLAVFLLIPAAFADEGPSNLRPPQTRAEAIALMNDAANDFNSMQGSHSRLMDLSDREAQLQAQANRAMQGSISLLQGMISGGSSKAALLAATKQMQETQMSFNLQYLQLQSQMQNENRSYTAVSNIMKTKHDTVKNSISNIR